MASDSSSEHFKQTDLDDFSARVQILPDIAKPIQATNRQYETVPQLANIAPEVAHNIRATNGRY